MLFTYMSVWINVGFTVKRTIEICAYGEARNYNILIFVILDTDLFCCIRSDLFTTNLVPVTNVLHLNNFVFKEIAPFKHVNPVTKHTRVLKLIILSRLCKNEHLRKKLRFSSSFSQISWTLPFFSSSFYIYLGIIT